MNKYELIKLLLSDEASESKSHNTSNSKSTVSTALPNELFEVGKKYFFRTVTYFTVGKISKIVENFIFFEPHESAWIADTGRFATDFLKEGNPSEVEPINTRWFLNIDSIVDGGEWNFDIPTVQK